MIPPSVDGLNPDKTLRRILDLADETQREANQPRACRESSVIAEARGLELAQQIRSLHNWIACGGNLPRAWVTS